MFLLLSPLTSLPRPTYIRIIVLSQHSMPRPLIRSSSPPLAFHPPRLHNLLPRLAVRQRPQTLRNPLPRIRHKPQTPTHSLAQQTPTPLRHAFQRAPRSLFRHAFRRLSREVFEPVPDPEREGLACYHGAGFPVGHFAVGGGLVAPEAR